MKTHFLKSKPKNAGSTKYQHASSICGKPLLSDYWKNSSEDFSQVDCKGCLKVKSIKVTRNGKTYDIPEVWLIGRMLADNADKGNSLEAYKAAIDSWIGQEEMSRRFEEEI